MSEALLSGLVRSLWFGGLAAVLLTLLCVAFPRLSPAWRHRAWFVVLLLCALQPFAPLFPTKAANLARLDPMIGPADPRPSMNRSESPTADRGETVSSLSSVVADEFPEPAADNAQSSGGLQVEAGFLPLLATLWIGGMLIGLVQLAGDFRRLIAIKRQAERPAERMIHLWDELSVTSRRRARLLISPCLTLPAACGYLHPAVLLPEALVTRLTQDQLRHLLLHEVAHLERWDDWSLLAERLLLLACWWHPVAWWACRQLDASRELACDALVVDQTEARAYARTLVTIAEWSLSPQPAIAPGALRGILSQRIEALIRRSPRPTVGARLSVGLGLGGLALVGLSVDPPQLRSRPVEIDPAIARHAHTGFAIGAAGVGLDSIFSAYEARGFSGTVLVARGDRILLDKGYGLADRERLIPVTRATRFSAAGMTKMFTAAAVLVLANDGRLSLTDSLGRWFPSLPADMGRVTIHQLLIHTDGLTRPMAPVYRQEPDAFLRAVGAGPASFAPGTDYRYNDFGYSILGLLVQRISGEPYEEFIRRRFLVPARLIHTSFESDGVETAIEYSGSAKQLTPIATRSYTWGRRGSLGLVTTTDDLFRWSRALADSAVLPASVWQQMRTTYGTTDWQAVAGYGWDRMLNRDGSGSVWRRVAGTPGMEGELLYDATNDWTAVILVNTRLGWRFKVWREIERALN